MDTKRKSETKKNTRLEEDLISKPVLQKLLTILSITLIIIAFFTGCIIISQQKSLVDFQIYQMSDRLSDAFYAELEDWAQGMEQVLVPISMDPRVIKSLVTADKHELLNDWSIVFEQLALTYNVNHFTFMDNNRRRILRVHNPEKSDGIVNRYTTLEAERTGKVFWGIETEQGSWDLPTLRVVKPVLLRDSIVGFIELGGDIENIIKDLQIRTKSHMVLNIHKKFLNRQRWEEAMKALQRDYNWGRLSQSVITFSTAELFSERIVKEINENDLDTVYKGSYIKENGRFLYLSAIKLYNAEGIVFGDLFYAVEITKVVLSYRKTIIAGVAIGGVLIAGLIIIFFFFLRKTDSVIQNQYDRLKESEVKFKSLVNNSPDTIMLVNTNGIITFINKPNLEDYVGRECLQLFHPSYHLKVEDLLDMAFEHNNQLFIEHIFQEKFFETRFVPLAFANKVNEVIIINSDLTERKGYEIIIKQQAEQYEEILNTSVNGFFIVNLKGEFVEANKALAEMSGYTREEMLKLRIRDLEVLDSDEQMAKRIKMILENGGATFDSEHKRKDGKIYNVRVNVAHSKTRNEFIGFITDITKEKEAESQIYQSNLRFKLAEHAANIGVWDWEVKNDRVHWSEGLKNIFGYDSLDNYSSAEFFLQHVHPQDKKGVRENIQVVLENNIPWYAEFRVIRKDKRVIWLRSSGKLFFNDLEGPDRMTGLVVDITDRKHNELMLSNSLKEKEMLLKEVHHRVKNNLQIISSLLYLQSLQINDKAVLEMLNISLNRIKSMALVHEFLYKSESLANIDFKQYVGELVSVIKASYGNKTVPVNINLDVHTNIRFDQIVYCGLIINELISNSLKYAFNNRSSGEINISVSKKQNQYLLMVSDNGIGISDVNSLSKGESLGSKIINELTRQLKGAMKIISQKGTCVEIIFPV